MKLADIIYQFNVLFPKVPKHTREEEKAIEKELVSRYAQGNICLHRGEYVTSEEIEERKKSIAAYSFE